METGLNLFLCRCSNLKSSKQKQVRTGCMLSTLFKQVRPGCILALVTGILALIPATTHAQTDGRALAEPLPDSVRNTELRDPKKATYLALALPGAGQIYNRKYWKLPLVYGAMGTSAVFLIYNRAEMRQANEELRYRYANNGAQKDPEYARYTSSALIGLRDQYKTYRDFSILALTGAYGLQVLDAVVDAHLSGFEMNQSISGLRIRPSFAPAAGIALRYTF
jgi:hypothetical protein